MAIIGFSSCRKKKKLDIQGKYYGEERFTKMYGSQNDTIFDTIYVTSINLSLKDNKTFVVSRSEYPNSYEINANRLVRNGSVTVEEYFPHETWTIQIHADGKLYGSFENDNNWAGSYEHYKFNGYK